MNIQCCGTCLYRKDCKKDRDEYDFPCLDWTLGEGEVGIPELR